MTASYTYTDAEYTKDTKLKGNTPEQVPEQMASLWGDYTFYEGPLSGLTPAPAAALLAPATAIQQTPLKWVAQQLWMLL